MADPRAEAPRRARRQPAPPARAESAAGDRALRIAGLALAGLAVLALAVYALAFRPVGDYLTESDFYSGYGLGARALLAGRIDFARYGVYGPVYEFLLAAAGRLVPDLFAAALALSVLGTAVVLLGWWRIAERRFGPAAALVLVALLVVNPTLVRYGYSASTDMVALALFTASAWATFALAGGRAAFAAGALAGLAALTRYNLVTLLPAAMLVELARGALPVRRRAARAALVLAGFLVPVLPWCAASWSAGHVPGATLFGDRAFYLQTGGGSAESRYSDLGAGVSRDAARPARAAELAATLAGGVARGLLEHPPRDARDLLGPPASLLSLAGLAAALLRRRARGFATFVPLLAITYASLAPVFYTERYSMVVAPLLLLPGAWLVGTIADARRRRPLPALAAAALALLVLGPTAGWAIEYHRACLEILPREAREAGEALRPLVKPGERMLARKAQAAWYAGVEPVPFPATAALPTLAAYCRARSVDYLYYSWYEAELRPAYAFLLDTSAAIPGLRALHVTRGPASVTYRVAPGFGTLPDWWTDEPVRRRVAARVNTLLRPGSRSVRFLLYLAADELARGRPAEALADAEAALRSEPSNAEARRLAEAARRALGPGGR